MFYANPFFLPSNSNFCSSENSMLLPHRAASRLSKGLTAYSEQLWYQLVCGNLYSKWRLNNSHVWVWSLYRQRADFDWTNSYTLILWSQLLMYEWDKWKWFDVSLIKPRRIMIRRYSKRQWWKRKKPSAMIHLLIQVAEHLLMRAEKHEDDELVLTIILVENLHIHWALTSMVVDTNSNNLMEMNWHG